MVLAKYTSLMTQLCVWKKRICLKVSSASQLTRFFLTNLQGGLGIFCKAKLGLQSSILDSLMHFLPGLYVSLCRLFFPDFDSEELEKELDILLQDTTKEPLDLPDNPQETFHTNSVPTPRISDAELEAELEKLSLSEGGTELYSQGCWWACGPLADSSEARG